MWLRATSTAQSAVGESATNVPTESGDADTTVSSSDGNTLTNLGAAQVAKTTCDVRDFQTKAFAKVKGFRGDEKAWPDWRYKFRVEASRCFRQAAAILDWAEDRYDQPISESDIQQVAAKENWADIASFNMQLHGDPVSLMRNTKTEAGLDAWRWLIHKCDPRNPLRNIQLLETLLAPTQVGDADVVANMERLRARAASGSPEI